MGHVFAFQLFWLTMSTKNLNNLKWRKLPGKYIPCKKQLHMHKDKMKEDLLGRKNLDIQSWKISGATRQKKDAHFLTNFFLKVSADQTNLTNEDGEMTMSHDIM